MSVYTFTPHPCHQLERSFKTAQCMLSAVLFHYLKDWVLNASLPADVASLPSRYPPVPCTEWSPFLFDGIVL